MPYSSVAWALWAANLGRAMRGVRTPVALCYHGIAEQPPEKDPHGLFISTAQFVAQLDALTSAGYRPVSAGRLWAAVRDGGLDAAAGLAAITFDDGLAETLDIAGRVLEQRGGGGTAFVLPGLLGEDHPDQPGQRLVDAEQLRALFSGPLEIGSHSLRHARLPELDDEALEADLRGSRETLEGLLDTAVGGLAYPYGHHSPAVRRAAERAGYAYAFACSGAERWERFAVPREPVFPSTSRRRLRAKVAGLYAPVTATAELRSRLRRQPA